MNYQKIYNQLIDKRRKNILIKNGDGSIEQHHIVPYCISKDNDESNLINLTCREHYIAHLLLYKIHKNTKFEYQMRCAVIKMRSISKCIDQRKYIKFNSRLFQLIRTTMQQSRKIYYKNMPKEKHDLMCKHISENHADVSGKNNPMYGKNIKDYMTPEKYEQYRKNLSIANSGKNNPFYGKTHTKETVEKIKLGLTKYYETHHAAFYGKHHSDDTKRKLSELKYGKKLSKQSKIQYNKTRIFRAYDDKYDLSEFDFDLYITLNAYEKVKYRKNYFKTHKK